VDAVVQHRQSALPDGGWLLLLLITGLVDTAYAFGRDSGDREPSLSVGTGVPVTLVMAGHQVAMQWCMDFLQPAACPVLLPSDGGVPALPHLVTLVRSVLLAKACLSWQPAELHHVSLLLVQAFVAALPDLDDEHVAASPAVADVVSQVRVTVVPGLDCTDSVCLPYTVLLDVPWPFGVSTDSRSWTHVRTILYTVSLTMHEEVQLDRDLAVHWDHGASVPNVDGDVVRRRQLHALVDQWLACAVKVVWCQKVIHPYLKAVLPRVGILAVERLSLRHVAAVHRLCGGQALASTRHDMVHPAILGAVGRVAEWVCADKRYIQVTGWSGVDTTKPFPGSVQAIRDGSDFNRPLPVSTLLLGVPQQVLVPELEASIQTGLALLAHTVTAAGCRLVAGGGVFESCLAAYLRARATRDLAGPTVALPPGLRSVHHGWLRQVVMSLADVLDQYVGAVSGHTLPWRSLAHALQPHHSELLRPVLEAQARSPAALARMMGCRVDVAHDPTSGQDPAVQLVLESVHGVCSQAHVLVCVRKAPRFFYLSVWTVNIFQLMFCAVCVGGGYNAGFLVGQKACVGTCRGHCRFCITCGRCGGKSFLKGWKFAERILCFVATKTPSQSINVISNTKCTTTGHRRWVGWGGGMGGREAIVRYLQRKRKM
jgi:hypothetical protein